ncbi:hypothetical protein LCGC14_0975490 [marine sediment metagenome]|uniref:sulfate adenylyltransferase n=1 Tax=marine sediment metagenome TaxID=412755 RepID=A0A0F9NA98_9ZZZZ
MEKLGSPHGGKLVNREPAGREREVLEHKIKSVKDSIKLDDRQMADLDLIAVGAFSPLEGFIGKADYDSVLQNMRLSSGLPFSIPITLAVEESEAAKLTEGEDVLLQDSSGKTVGVLHLEEKYKQDKEKEAQLVYRTTDTDHPGVKYLQDTGDILLGGKISLLERAPVVFGEYAFDPAESRAKFKENGWRRVVGFQTRNPVHRAHEYIQKCALEAVDGLFLHPIVGATKDDDIPADVRMNCYNVLLDNYYPKNRVVLGTLPAAMRYAGPREAIFHAIVRKNYGCTHFIVGRDHAGVGNYYGSFDAHAIFDEFEEGELGITPLFFDYTFYCKHCGGMASYKSCPHDSSEHISLSGTKVREMLKEGKLPPAEFSRPEVAQILIDWATKDK